MEKEMLNRRKNYFIDKKFQSIFIVKFCALVVIGSLISGVIIYIMSKSTVTTTFENSRLIMKSTADFILPAVLLSSTIVIAITGLAAIVVTLFASHKISGPLYRMEKDIEEVAAGNLKKKFTLRESDQLKMLAKSFDNMTDELRDNINLIKGGISELERLAGSDEEKKKIEDIKKVLSKFNT